jgi:hypothetical protein
MRHQTPGLRFASSAGVEHKSQPPAKKTDQRPLEPKLRPEGGPNRAARAYPSPSAAQDLAKKTDTEQPHGAGGT